MALASVLTGWAFVSYWRVIKAGMKKVELVGTLFLMGQAFVLIRRAFVLDGLGVYFDGMGLCC